MPLCFVSIGSNIDREQNIRSALQSLHDAFGPLLVSSIRDTVAVGFDGDPFLNLAVGFFTEKSPQQTVVTLSHIEQAHGRLRGGARFGARTLDLDLLLYGDLLNSDLKIPRAEIDQQAFVLEPLAEIAPQRRHPLSGRTFAHHWREFEKKN